MVLEFRRAILHRLASVYLARFFMAKRVKFSATQVFTVLFLTVIVTPMVLSVVGTEFRQSLAFYLLPARAWEFATGALLAVLPSGALTPGNSLSRWLTLSGAALLISSFLLVDSNTSFPGYLAGGPVLGTLMIIAAGNGTQDNKNVVSRVLESRILQWVGNRSYSWYLCIRQR